MTAKTPEQRAAKRKRRQQRKQEEKRQKHAERIRKLGEAEKRTKVELKTTDTGAKTPVVRNTETGETKPAPRTARAFRRVRKKDKGAIKKRKGAASFDIFKKQTDGLKETEAKRKKQEEE